MTDTKDTMSDNEETKNLETPSAEETSDLPASSSIGKEFPEPAAQAVSEETLVEEEYDDEEKPSLDEENLTPAETFEELELAAPLMEAIKNIGWPKPTTIQGLCLPLTTRGQDLAGFSQTGTGKTGVFLITIAHQIMKLREAGLDAGTDPKAIILAPTRELAVQISSDAEGLFKQLSISCLPVFGGVDYEKQAQSIRSGVDVIVATPGRLKDYFQKRIFTMKECCLFICDEADRMLDMGFIEDVEFFLSKLSPETQKMLFSATTNEKVKELAFEYLESPKYISANPEVMTPERIQQFAVVCESTEKLQVMLGLLRDHQPQCSIIFVNTKMVAEWLQYKLKGNGIEVDLITGDLPQNKRIALIQRIKNNEVKALIATDVASRGLHISGITHVYNFDLPDDAANYVHRIGRTARAGASGSAYSLVCEDYGHNLLQIQKYLGENIAIQTVWFPEDYLQIEDKAGNPYKDETFKGNRMKDEESRSSGRGGSRTGKSGGKGDGPRGQKGDGRRGGDARRERGDGNKDRPARAGAQAEGNKKAQQQPRNQKQQGKQPDRKPHKKAHTGEAPSQNNRGGDKKLKVIAPASTVIKPVRPIKKDGEIPNTLLGMFKKIFSAFFKRKK